jgi:hypothetical protein
MTSLEGMMCPDCDAIIGCGCVEEKMSNAWKEDKSPVAKEEVKLPPGFVINDYQEVCFANNGVPILHLGAKGLTHETVAYLKKIAKTRK